MGYWKCCFLFKLEDLSVLSLWGKDPKESHSNRHNIIPTNHTPASAQEPGPFPGSFHLIVCSNPAGSLHECLLRESRGKGRPQNSRRTRPARETCNSAVWIFYKQKVVLPSPSRQTHRMTSSLPRWTVHHSVPLQLFPSAALWLSSSQLFSLLEQLSLSLAHKVWTEGKRKSSTFTVRIISRV